MAQEQAINLALEYVKLFVSSSPVLSQSKAYLSFSNHSNSNSSVPHSSSFKLTSSLQIAIPCSSLSLYTSRNINPCLSILKLPTHPRTRSAGAPRAKASPSAAPTPHTLDHNPPVLSYPYLPLMRFSNHSLPNHYPLLKL